jgi:bifunctional non-homologous end joining protein LigD
VAQIGFTEVTGDGKLRHLRFPGLRRDKRPREVVLERPAA